MPPLYLTPAALGYLSIGILSTTITIYLTLRLLRGTRSTPTVLFACFFAATTLFISLLFFDAALAPTPRLYAVYLENTTTGLILIFLLQFAYRFPRLDPRKKWEARVWLGYAVLYTLWEALFALFRFARLQSGAVEYRPPYADYALAVGFLWVPIVFLRQVVFTSTDDRAVSRLHKLWRPYGSEAQAARALALVYLFPLVLNLANIFRGSYLISPAMYQFILSAGIGLMLFVFAIVYLNALPETTSFMVKLAGVMLTSLLLILSAVGWVMTPVYASEYRPNLLDHQTLRFTPNANGGYDVTQVSFHFNDDLGRKIETAPGDRMNIVALDFVFSFYGQTYDKIYVTDVGIISVGKPFLHSDLQYHYGSVPAIFPLGIDLDARMGDGMFARNDGERLILTWSNLPAWYRRQARLTFQLVLERNGVFEVTYNGMPRDLGFEPDSAPYTNVWMVGVLPGDSARVPQSVNLADLPLRGGSQGFVDDYYLEFRDHLHQLLAPLAYLILISSLLISMGFPLLLYVSLVLPLNTLLEGVRQVNAGNRAIAMPVRDHDEIGFLTESFNGMVATVRDLIATLETRVAERTASLTTTNARLREEMIEREQAQVQMFEQQRALVAMEGREQLGRELHDGLGQVMGYINVQAQATETFLANGQTDIARKNLAQMAQAAQDAHGDIRNYILGLRIPSVVPGTLIQTLETYLHQFGETCHIEATLSCPINLSDVAPKVEDQILRIVLEALTNVRKYAIAHKVEVQFSVVGEQIQVIVADDGIGFDSTTMPSIDSTLDSPNPSAAPHLGLNIMRQRAEQIGGRLEIQTASGQGTRVIAFFPRELPKEREDQALAAEVAGMRVLLVDDHPLFLDGLRNLLIARGITVVGTARDGMEAQEEARALRPDVIVMDIQMPRCNGLDATRIIKAEQPGIKIVMLTTSESEDHLYEAIRYGASGYLLKNLNANEFCRLLIGLMRGEGVLTPALAAHVLAEFSHRQTLPDKGTNNPTELTPRQWEILELVVKGLTYKQVGDALYLTEQTIKYHMGQILDRLHLQNRAQAIAYALQVQSKKTE